MVEQMGGTIRVADREDHGSCFNFSFCCDLQVEAPDWLTLT
jgi:signal transduction histidine kinase